MCNCISGRMQAAFLLVLSLTHTHTCERQEPSKRWKRAANRCLLPALTSADVSEPTLPPFAPMHTYCLYRAENAACSKSNWNWFQLEPVSLMQPQPQPPQQQCSAVESLGVGTTRAEDCKCLMQMKMMMMIEQGKKNAFVLIFIFWPCWLDLEQIEALFCLWVTQSALAWP